MGNMVFKIGLGLFVVAFALFEGWATYRQEQRVRAIVAEAHADSEVFLFVGECGVASDADVAMKFGEGHVPALLRLNAAGVLQSMGNGDYILAPGYEQRWRELGETWRQRIQGSN